MRGGAGVSGHTPGPWFAESPTCYWIRARGGKSLHIGRTDMGGLSLEEQRANARMMAAAPALLDFAKWVADRHDEKSVEGQAARAVIAIATGEPQ